MMNPSAQGQLLKELRYGALVRLLVIVGLDLVAGKIFLIYGCSLHVVSTNAVLAFTFPVDVL